MHVLSIAQNAYSMQGQQMQHQNAYSMQQYKIHVLSIAQITYSLQRLANASSMQHNWNKNAYSMQRLANACSMHDTMHDNWKHVLCENEEMHIPCNNR